MFHLALFGNPVEQSLSPKIHEYFAAQFDINLRYEKILVPLNQFTPTADAFISNGAFGFNVTAPFKKEAYDWVQERTERALNTKAVNTVFLKNGRPIGDNADGFGLIQDLHKKNIPLRNQIIIICGAGGATSGIIPSLLDQSPKKLIVITRDSYKKKLFSASVHIASYIEFPKFLEENTLLIDATSNFERVQQILSSQQSLPQNLTIYDLKYCSKKTNLVKWGLQEKLRAYDGLGMLIGQAKEAFYRWFGVHPETTGLEKMIGYLPENLSQ